MLSGGMLGHYVTRKFIVCFNREKEKGNRTKKFNSSIISK
jgi:hypothetical protein